MAAGKEPAEVQGDGAETHQAEEWAAPAEDHRRAQPGDPGVGQLLPRGSTQRAAKAGEVDTAAPAQHPAPARRPPRKKPRTGSPPLPKCLADCPRADLSEPDHPRGSRW